MTEHPEDAFDAFVGAGVTELLFHVEATRFPFRALQLLKRSGIGRGVAVNPATQVESVVPLLDSVGTVLLMSVEPGFGGQSFLQGTLAKVRALRSAADRADGVESPMIEQAPVRVSISVLGADFTQLGHALERIRL